jgi:hypothetical protein
MVTRGTTSRFGAAILALACICSGGCGEGGSVPVEGTVTLQGKPLSGATVMFTSMRGNGPGPFVGKTDQSGRFSLGPSDATGSGAAAGEYSVIIATVVSDPNETAPAKPTKEVVPNRYRLGAEKFVVPAGGTTEALFSM